MKRCLILVMCLVFLVSCETATPTRPIPYEGLTHAVFKLDVSDPGAFHNDIAIAYGNRRAALGDGPITRREFVRLMIDATNETFVKRGLPAVATRADMERVIGEIQDLRQRGVFDFFSDEPGPSRAIVDDWERRGIVSEADAEAVRKELRREDSNSSSKAVLAFRSVYGASMDLWRDPAFLSKSGLSTRKLQRFDVEPLPDKGALLYQMDSLGTLLGHFLGGGVGAMIGAAIFSWAIVECPPAEMGSWEHPGYGLA